MIELNNPPILDLDLKRMTEIDNIIQSSFMNGPSNLMHDYKSDSAAHHLNVLNIKGKPHILVNNKLGNADFLELESTE